MSNFGIVLDNMNKYKMKFNNDSTLSEVRKLIEKKITEEFNFLDTEEFEIEDDLENETKISEISLENKIYLKSKTVKVVKHENNFEIRKKNIPLENAELLREEKGLKIYQYPRIEFTQYEESIANIILIVGQTGSGKTTFINGFINYLMEIELDDDFRYVLIIEKERLKTESQTKGLHIYNIRSRKMNLKIIDTQGYGDTSGISEDEKITLTIKDSFMKEINSLNTVLFVVKSSDTRLTLHQKYIFSSIISLFGKDIRQNFLSLITFYNGTDKPSAVTTLEQSEFKNIISYIQKPWYLCFDSNLLYSDPSDELNQLGYKRAKNNYKILCDRITSLNRNSLQQSKENLNIRAKIEMKCKALTELLRMQMDKLVEIEDQKKYIKENENKINSKETKYDPRKRIEYIKEKLPNGEKATVCKICHFNCHYPCKDTSVYGYDVLKYTCKIWSWGFNCTFCPNNCPQSCHELADHIFKKTYKTEYIKVEEMINENEKGKLTEGLNFSKKVLKKLEAEEEDLKKKIKLTQEEVKQKYAELKKIAINCTSYQTTMEFLHELIAEEMKQREEGYQKRIELYEKMIEENKGMLKNIKI